MSGIKNANKAEIFYVYKVFYQIGRIVSIQEFGNGFSRRIMNIMVEYTIN
jgi:hypothetical protein